MTAIVTYDQERVQEIVDGTTVNGAVNGSKHLILTRRDNATVDAGAVEGPQGFRGPELPHKPGHISLYAGTTPPLGWVFCDGSIVSRSNYAELFAAIGTTYGSGDGSTTFHLPDLRGRIPVGLDTSQTEFNALGARGGAKTHTLDVTQIPAHTHLVTGKAGIDNKDFDGFSGGFAAADTATGAYDQTLNSVGGGVAHNNIAPYQTLNYIIAIGKAAPQGGGVAKARYFTATGRGTTAQRDAKYGVPSTAAARVALANQQSTWFNTDLGWKERYYEISSAAGLTARGLFTDAPAGWYPIGDGPAPFIELEALAEVAQFYNTFITGWSIYGRKGGTSWFTLNGTDRVNVLKPGRYDLKAFTTQYAAAGGPTPDYSLQILGTDNSTVVRLCGGGAFKQDPNFNTRPHQELYDQYILANQKVGWKLQPGTTTGTNMQIHGGGSDIIRGRLSIKYVAPPLSDLT